ncbi:MAG: GNAT family N-acetyltransferase [Candidatus Parvarchaeota archaeon]|nr:GNAT family N-acetyltransferase [Candidatus Parvarchaeum tengchongense]MCW1298892.1 GNAT family N-acetyltransferase [Candidatus Parvarchaeum tengchongense]MCW1312408.1 GNAT family N-acetyltransferase [Candidatus Parvarchaeum tengchongense]
MTCCHKTAILFISEAKNGFYIRDYKEKDLAGIYAVYKSAFSEEPWNEYKKCSLCKVNYGIKESDNPAENCKKCGKPLKLEDYWTEKDVNEDINYAKSKEWNSVLVADSSNEILGFTWAYKVNLEKDMSFLKKAQNIDCSKKIIYVDEVATAANSRGKGVATELEKKLFSRAENAGFEYVILRTDERNTAAMNLYRKLGFEKLRYGVSETNTNRYAYDPEFNSRIYLVKKLMPSKNFGGNEERKL